MCLAIPAQVIELEPFDMAKVRIGESGTTLSVSTMLLPESAEIGDYVIVHAGFALHRLSAQEAQDSLTALRELAETAYGQAVNF